MRVYIFILFGLVSNLLLSQNSKTIDISAAKRFSIGLEGRTFDLKSKTNGNNVKSAVSEYPYALQFNLSYTFFPSHKLILEGGLGYGKTQQIISVGKFLIPYSEKEGKIDANNNLLTNYEYPLNTAFGKQTLNIEILTTPENERFMEGDMMAFGSTTKTSMDWFYIPITLKFFLKGKKVKYFIKGGGIFNLFQNQNISKKQIGITNLLHVLNSERVLINNFSVTIEPKTLNRFTIDAVFGGGIESKIGQKFFVYAIIDYNIGLIPVYENELLSTTFNSFGLSIGTRFFL